MRKFALLGGHASASVMDEGMRMYGVRGSEDACCVRTGKGREDTALLRIHDMLALLSRMEIQRVSVLICSMEIQRVSVASMQHTRRHLAD